MASVATFDVEVELKSPADAFWNTIRDLNFVYPKLFPELYKSIEFLEGDGRSAGTIRLVTYADGVNFGKSYKSKIESIDEENKTVAYRVLEGDLLKYYKFIDDTITVRSKGKGSVAVWTYIYEKAIKEAPEGEAMKASLVEVLQKLDAYTLANIKT